MTAGEAAGRHLVVVHGVGVHPLGALRDRLAADLLRPGEIAHRRDAYLGGRLYPSLEIGDPRRPRLRVREVHWSDLAPAPRRGVPLLSFVIQLVSAMVRLAARGWREDGRGAAGRSRVGAWFRVVFATLLVWAISVPTMLRLAAIVANPLVAAAAILAVAAVVAFLAARFAAAEPLLRAGYGWAVATALVGLAFALHPGLDPASAGALARAVGAVPLLGALMLPLAVVELTIRWARDRHLTGEPALVLAVRLALFVLVVLLLSAALAVVWAASLWASALLVGLGIADGAALTAWNAAHYDASLYNIDLMELVNGGAAFLAGTYLLAAFALWAALTHLASPLRLPTGRILRAGLRLFFPLLLALAGGVMVVFVLDVLDLVPWLEKRRLCDVPHLCDFWGVDRAVPDSARLTVIYTLSAARLLPFLALLVGPMRLALDVAADVLLYLDRSGPAATGDEARARLARLLDHLAGAGASEVAVFAHSQGARIAVDALAARPPADCHGGASGEARMEPAPALRLVTVGAPLDTLYARFLHLAAPVPAVAEWWNLYRPSDFVGGPIARGPCHAPRDQVLARHYRRSHFDYWGEAEVLAAALGTRT